eukprot:m.85255 g.85255  ORF g.85255 m.85255 type:complete len:70 (-) comp50864_c0_seq11:290-499(-)
MPVIFELCAAVVRQDDHLAMLPEGYWPCSKTTDTVASAEFTNSSVHWDVASTIPRLPTVSPDRSKACAD